VLIGRRKKSVPQDAEHSTQNACDPQNAKEILPQDACGPQDAEEIPPQDADPLPGRCCCWVDLWGKLFLYKAGGIPS
jgi:hypothetical protein